MKSFTTAVNRPTHWKAHSFFVLLVLCLIDIGVVTDVMLKAHPEDYWKVDRIEIERLDRDGKPLEPIFISKWDDSFPKLIDGNFPKGKNKWRRASNIARPKTELVGQGVDVIVKREAIVSNNLYNTDGKEDCGNRQLTVNISEGYATEKSNTSSFTATFGARIMVGVPDVFEAEASYGFEVATSMSEAFSNSQTLDAGNNYSVDLCASPGTIRYEIHNYVETRQYGEVSYLGGKERFYKVIGARWVQEGGDLVRTYKEVDAYLADPSSDPELARAIELTPGQTTIEPRSKSLPAISFGNDVNVSEGGDTPPVPQPVDGKATTSQLEICDAGGSVVGHFKKSGNGWVETDINGNTKFRFSETRSDQGVIYLSDKDRQGVKINLDTNNKEVLYSDPNNTTPFRIYIISKIN
jgi:hypothetical protein